MVLTGCKLNGKVCPNCGKIHKDMTGDNNPARRPEVRKKISVSMIGKMVGDKNPMKNPVIRKKHLLIMREIMTGDKNPAKRPEVRAKIIKALTGNPKISGENSVMKRPEVRAKFMGDKNPMKRPEVRAKHKKAVNKFCREDWYREKLSKALTGRKNTWGHKLTKEANPERIIKMIKAQKGVPRPHCSGKNHWNWQDGKSFEPYSPEFNRQLKEFIRNRDGRVCQFPDCGLPENGTKHLVHHINYNKKDCRPENLVLLCRSHNSVVNFNRDYWKTCFQEKMRRIKTC